MAEDCLFCKIVEGSVPATKVHEDGGALAFEDLNPQAPTHVLVIPKQHFTDLADLASNADGTLALVRGIGATVETLGLSEFRTVFNTGRSAGQTVFHVHAHILAGRQMTWPPG
jgi:histidine triad (HIT) family protein